MELNEILSELNLLFRRVLANKAVELKMDTTAKDVDGWDSLNHMFLISSIEEHYKIRFALKEIIKLKNVEDMCRIVQSKINS
ncbi:MAG: acyl carrier protein [Bacteroidetes bacterium]|nr:acyl carrier protein [Bacteroidota bacterium]